MAARVRAGMQWQQYERDTQGDKDTCLVISSLPTQTPVQGYDLSTFCYTAEMYLMNLSQGVHCGASSS